MRVDIVQNGKTLRRISHDGEVYVAAPSEGTYTICLYNHGSQRRLAVVTVDGINVVSGKEGTFSDRGYVLGPWETIDIPGWSRGNEEVAAFEFRPENQSYSAAMGKGISNVGVIGVAVFDERKVPVWNFHHHHYPTVLYSSNTVPPDHTGAAPDLTPTFTCSTEQPSSGVVLNDTLDVGTGYGAQLDFQTTTVDFDRSSTAPTEVVVLRYATKARLREWGVPVHHKSVSKPRPFPSEGCPAPPGWIG